MGPLNSIVKNLIKTRTDSSISQDINQFSLNKLINEYPIFGNYFTWNENPFPHDTNKDYKLHIGCGDNLIDGFINIDFLPIDSRVLKWNLLDIWPEKIHGKISKIFSEDVLEHFFFNEQCYILCSANICLKGNGIFRVLMPNLDKLIEYKSTLVYNSDDWFINNFGVKTGADAFNLGMRFGGHRWLHNNESLDMLSRECGYSKISSKCNNSMDEELSYLNMRSENNSLSFANDLVKKVKLNYISVLPAKIKNAILIEKINENTWLYKSTNNDAQVTYRFNKPIDVNRITCVNARGVNFSQFYEHNYSEMFFDESNPSSVVLDSSMRSNFHCNIVSYIELGMLKLNKSISHVRFDPSKQKEEYFTVGPMELFYK